MRQFCSLGAHHMVGTAIYHTHKEHTIEDSHRIQTIGNKKHAPP